MENLMLELLNKEIPFVFDGTDININELNISKYFQLYHVSYGEKGYPYLKIFKDVGEVVDFIKKHEVALKEDKLKKEQKLKFNYQKRIKNFIKNFIKN